MTYSQIKEWVAVNFDVSTYGDPKELWLDVGKRFNQDNMYLPPEAESYVTELWEEQVGIKRPAPEQILGSTIDDYISVVPRGEPPVTIAPPQVFQPFEFDLGKSVIEQVSVKPEPQGMFSFRDIGKTLRSAFKRFFRL